MSYEFYPYMRRLKNTLRLLRSFIAVLLSFRHKRNLVFLIRELKYKIWLRRAKGSPTSK